MTCWLSRRYLIVLVVIIFFGGALWMGRIELEHFLTGVSLVFSFLAGVEVGKKIST